MAKFQRTYAEEYTASTRNTKHPTPVTKKKQLTGQTPQSNFPQDLNKANIYLRIAKIRSITVTNNTKYDTMTYIWHGTEKGSRTPQVHPTQRSRHIWSVGVYYRMLFRQMYMQQSQNNFLPAMIL